MYHGFDLFIALRYTNIFELIQLVRIVPAFPVLLTEFPQYLLANDGTVDENISLFRLQATCLLQLIQRLTLVVGTKS
jgi:hypothetical protein